MTIVRATWPQARPILGGAALAVAVFINAISLGFGIVLWPLIVLTVTYPLATLLSLVVGVRIGGWSGFAAIPRFAIGIAVAFAGLVAYLLTIGWSNGFSNGDTPPIFDVAFFGAALLLVAGYGIILSVLLREIVVLVRRAL